MKNSDFGTNICVPSSIMYYISRMYLCQTGTSVFVIFFKGVVMKKTMLMLCLSVMVSVPGIAKASLAGTVEIKHDGYGAKGLINIYGGGLNDQSTTAGVFALQKSGSTGSGDLWDDGTIAAFCIDLSQTSQTETRTYDVISLDLAPRPITFLDGPMGEQKKGLLQELWGRFYDAAWAPGNTYTSQQNGDAEAFGAAIWEIVYEDYTGSSADYDISADGTDGSRGFKAENLDIAQANFYLHALDGTGPMADLAAFSSDCNQDFIAEVPEPATIALLAFGGIALFRKKR